MFRNTGNRSVSKQCEYSDSECYKPTTQQRQSRQINDCRRAKNTCSCQNIGRNRFGSDSRGCRTVGKIKMPGRQDQWRQAIEAENPSPLHFHIWSVADKIILPLGQAP
ncbi:hypothetical protein JTE90_012126 [Oedothorax gibbosus]|uniref:Uncharacterized protein n=1 Tax=Oedothorax gibbosus TaxID=931172 RepID=A0AAV6TQ47_9ARAC|nr:hypothetical protein JTE90_012126 [Oedothorax gibbosus]